ncbi:hypothetical protein [Fibrella forsythiae]|uniref:Uncharacterized protein n=1 Tax=Fibrella forsythiae TaxID=2817061 RepID=A0ABS3JUJ5_9BACT|nr:hypothetical protein [Fibrella forsythiae]MBO0953071.1 hypothetical protein [Fibrella forsythiae]
MSFLADALPARSLSALLTSGVSGRLISLRAGHERAGAGHLAGQKRN